MNRRIWTLTISVAMVFAIGLVLQPTAVGKKAPDVIVMKKCAKKKPATKFPHKKHLKVLKGKVKCKTCHHKGMKVKNCTSGNCHLKPQKGVKACTSGHVKKNPFHKQCIGCHKKMKKGPKKCKACHKK
jgi:hypothetical protein